MSCIRNGRDDYKAGKGKKGDKGENGEKASCDCEGDCSYDCEGNCGAGSKEFLIRPPTLSMMDIVLRNIFIIPYETYSRRR